MKLAVEVYKITKKLPLHERYILISQINKCAVSIPSNIAEGCGRNSNKEYMYFLSIAQGSAFELETQLLICQELDYAKSDDLKVIFSTIHEIENMLFSLQNKLKKTIVNNYIALTISCILLSALCLVLST